MTDRTTLSTLTAASSKPIVVRRLRCPDCGAEVRLSFGSYCCDTPACSFVVVGEILADLAVGEVLEARDG